MNDINAFCIVSGSQDCLNDLNSGVSATQGKNSSLKRIAEHQHRLDKLPYRLYVN